MALDTYSGLKASVADFLNRADLTATIPDFIALAEAQTRRRLRRAWEEARTLPRSMVISASFAITAETVALPSDFIGAIAFTIDSQAVKLKYLSPDAFEREKARRGTSQTATVPEFFTIIGANFKFLPVPDVTYTGTLDYWQSFTALSGSNASNWILANHPDVYLYGALIQSAPYLKDDARLSTWGTLFTGALDDLINSDPLPADEATLRVDDGITFNRNRYLFDINTGEWR